MNRMPELRCPAVEEVLKLQPPTGDGWVDLVPRFTPPVNG